VSRLLPAEGGAITFGTGKENDVVLPPELKGTGPDRLGTPHLDADAERVVLRPAAGVTILSDMDMSPTHFPEGTPCA
jgi:hypothetical protein